MSLSERIQTAQIERERIAAANQQRREDERRQQNEQRRKDLEAAQLEIKQYESEKARLDAELADIQRRESLTPEQRREEDLSSINKSLSEKYDPQITNLKQQRDSEVNRIIQQVAKSGQGPEGWKEAARLTAKPFDERIETLERQRVTELQQALYAYEYPGRTLQGSVLRTFKAEGGQVSLVGLQQRQDAAAEARRLYNIESSKQTARSEAIKFEKEELEKIKRDFTIKKSEADKQYEIQTESLKDISFETKVKKEPGIRRSDPLKDLPYQTPKSIYGTTQEKSNLARETLALTEQQQRQLEYKIRTAPNAQEAARLRKEFFTEKGNAYLGTANVYQYKGKTLDTKGVTIEEKLNESVKDFDKITKSDTELTPKETKQIKIELEESLNISENLGGEAVRYVEVPSRSGKQSSGIPEVIFADEKGNEIPSTVEGMFAYRQELLKQTQINFTPSKTDLELAKYEKENLEAITAFESTEAAKTSGSITPLVDRSKTSFESGVMGQADEIADMIRGKQTAKPSIETLAISDLTNEIKAGIGISPRAEPETIKTIEQNLKTPEGTAWLAGSLVGSAGVAAATVIVPGFAAAKLAKLTARQTLKEAEQIAFKYSYKAPDEKFIIQRQKEIKQQLKTKFPDMQTSELNNLARRMEIKERLPKGPRPQEAVPYEVKLINNRTALITIGTESSESKVILYTRSKSIIFNPPKGTESIYKNFLVKGRPTDKPELRQQIIKQFPNLPKTPEGKAILEQQVRTISTDLDQARLLFTRKQSIQAQKEQPLLKETKEQIRLGDEKRLRRTVRGTDNLYYDKSDLSTAPATTRNIEKISDDNSYAFLGTAKIVDSKLLRNYTTKLLKSLDDEDPLKATGIFERKPNMKGDIKTVKVTESKTKPPQPRPTTKARSYTEGDFAIEIPTTKPTTKTTTTTKSDQTPKPSDLADLAEDLGKSINQEINLALPSTAKTATISIKETPPSQTTAQPPRTKTASQKSPDVKIISESISTSLNDQVIDLKTATAQTITTKTTTKQSPSQQLQQELDNIQISRLKINPDTSQKDLIDTGVKLTRTTKTDQPQAGRWSLIADQPQKEKELEALRFKITEKTRIIEKLIPKLDIPTETKRPPRTTTRIPPTPYFKVDPRQKQQKQPKPPKKGKLYFRWNVNELSPGYYLPTKELSTGKTVKAITRIEKVQRREARRKIRFKLK